MVWKKDLFKLTELFSENRFALEQQLPVQIDFLKEGQPISVLSIGTQDNGIGVEGIPSWIWHADALSFPPQQLHRLTSTVLSPRQLLEEKDGYLSGTGKLPRQKDILSMQLLRQMLGFTQ